MVKLKYRVEIVEKLIRRVEIEAKDEQKAIDEIMDQYMKEKIVLGSEDYESTDFNIVE